jgi:hypothetical protein
MRDVAREDAQIERLRAEKAALDAKRRDPLGAMIAKALLVQHVPTLKL